MPTDTIFALSSGRPPAGVAVVRMSGPGAIAALGGLAGAVPPARVATLAVLRDEDGVLLDRALVLAFPAPNSFTGEDVVELHVHGGAAVIVALLGALGRITGLRLAEPGEFSRRAFDNGKLDLSQAEGLADLIAAESEAQRRQALAQAGGRLRDRAEDWRLRLLALQAQAEAGLDFADEGDVDDMDSAEPISALAAEIAATLDDGGFGERLRDGFAVAVVGPPNAGKSSIINTLSGRDVAIVTAVPGTTRDVIEVPMTIGGVSITLLDTAGIRDSADPIEAEGIRRARSRAANADLVLNVVDGETGARAEIESQALTITIVNKSDLGTGGGGSDLLMSAKTGAGVDRLRTALLRWAEEVSVRAEAALITQSRHRSALKDCFVALDDAVKIAEPVLRAESLRHAATAIGRITGRVGVENMLDALFGRFCIGK